MDTVRRYFMLIDGAWVDTEDRFEIRSPATEELVASVAKGGIEHADRAIEAGTVWVNDWHMVNAAYPFGGYKQSGLGRELGPHALDEYTEEKFVHLDLSGRLDRRAYALLLGTPPA
jgi:acyl-CoA reductase-like NAD-dependent aldehyde dehydrogenase